MLKIATSATYWILVLIWSYILFFYSRRLKTWRESSKLIYILFVVLSVDAFRTLFESVYFGAWYTSLSGFLPDIVADILTKPEFVFIPKIINVIAGLIIVKIILFHWVPEENKERLLIEKNINMLESQVKDRTEELKELFDGAALGILLVDRKGRILDANREACTKLGYRQDEIRSFSLVDIVSQIDYVTQKVDSNIFLDTPGSSIRLELRCLCKDKSSFWVELISQKLHIGPNYLVMFLDITERKRVVDALKQSEQKFRAIFDQTYQFIGLLSVDGTLLEANRSALEFSGIKESEVIGKPFWETTWWSHSQEMQEKLCAAIKKVARGEFIRFEATHTDTGGNIHYVDFSLKPVLDENGHVVLIIPEGRDITARKRMEDELHKLNQELEQRVQERTAELSERNIELNRENRERKQAEAELYKAKAQLEESNRLLETLSVTDPLTGLANRRRFDEALAKEHARHVRSGAELSMVMLDIDHFKEFNDSYGHVNGDACLQRIALVIAECAARAADIAARYGGEEFACILPETDLKGALVIAEKIRLGIQNLAIPHSSSAVSDCVTASLGVVTLKCTAETPASEIVVQADTMLYKAKIGGRNRVEAKALISRRQPDTEISPARLVWKDVYCSGNLLVDTQHRELFQISNELLDAIQSLRPNIMIFAIAERLLEKIAQHFHDEEALLESSSFPDREAHAKEHARLYEKGSELAQTLLTETPVLGEVLNFLVYEVVFRHMCLTDQKFFPHIGQAQNS